MHLRNHYLEEDYPTMVNELDKLGQTALSVLNSARTANFTDKKKHIDQIDESLKVLMFLNKKKLEYEKEKSTMSPNEQVRRNWF